MSKFTIQSFHAREVWDSRGSPTIEVEVTLNGGCTGRAIATSGASVGSFEAPTLYDGGTRLNGRGVKNLVKIINEKKVQ